jgi:hypothetical protein
VSATVLENIVANIVTTLQGITVDDGFDFDMGGVERFETSGNSLAALPAGPKALVSTMPQRKFSENTRFVEWDLEVWIQHFLVHDKEADARSTDEVLIEHRSNLYKALMADRFRGGYAQITTVEEMSDFDLEHAEGHDTGVNVTLGVRFRHLVGDPWTQA